MDFKPSRVLFEKEALAYPLGEQLLHRFRLEGVPIRYIGSHNRVTGIPGSTPQEAYREAKNTLVIGVRRTLRFESCKPSAHYQLPLSTSCIGKCEYCYLNTTLGKKPYLRIYVNIEEILAKAREYIVKRKPEVTVFEGAATSDPLPFEEYTRALGRAISFFGQQELGRFRFVTKFTAVDSLLPVEHNGHTRFRFSLNTRFIIEKYEHRTPSVEDRIAAAEKVARAGYPLGFLLAPVIIYPDWRRDYDELLQTLSRGLPRQVKSGLTFEVITHRFTAKAKTNILQVFPGSTLPMAEEERRFKFGQFGYGKYLYPPETMAEVKSYFREKIALFFPEAILEYVV